MFTLLLYTFNLGGARVLTKHELHIAGPAKQMVNGDGWLMPRVGDHLWVEKPPLPTWLAAISVMLLGGVSEVAVRLPSVLAGLGVVLIVAGLSARWFGPTVGFLAGLIQASTVYMITYSRLAESDMVLALFVVGAIGAFVKLQSVPLTGDDRSRRTLFGWQLFFWFLIGLTNWAKGVVFGTVLALAPCLGWLAWRKDWTGLRKLWSPAGVLMAAVMAVAWRALTILQDPAMVPYLMDNFFGRVTGRVMTPEPIWYYLTTWLWQVLPWTPLVLLGGGPSLKRAWQQSESPDRFIWCWALVPLALLSVPSVKCHHYLIHALPALSPIMALGLVRCQHWFAEKGERAKNVGQLSLWVIAPILFLGGVGAAWLLPRFRTDAFLLGSMAAIGISGVGLFLRRLMPARAFGVLLVTIVAAELYVHGWVLPRRDPSAADRDFLSAVERMVPPKVRLLGCEQLDVARYVFYIDRPMEGFWNCNDVGSQLSHEHKETVFVIARGRNEEQLLNLGKVTRVAQSERTRRERSPEDRYTLFRIDPRVAGRLSQRGR
ncbi:MAG: ArnT family glycosyltransferase [Candidatus Methylomirabilales bacterium]